LLLLLFKNSISPIPEGKKKTESLIPARKKNRKKKGRFIPDGEENTQKQNKTKQKNSVFFFTFSFEDVIKDQEKQEHNKSTAKQ